MQRSTRPERANKTPKNRVNLNVEVLETRLVLSSGMTAASGREAMGFISGHISNDANGRGLGRVSVELIAASNQVVATTRTGPLGNYLFRVRADGPYVVHAVSPRRFTQTSPTFSNVEPTGSYATNPKTGLPYNSSSWNYHTGNNDPANGPVGPAWWSTVAPAGDEPFESPINIQGSPIDLSQYLSINYQNAIPKAIVNNGAQIQTQFASTTLDTMSLHGQSYTLSQFHLHDPSENQVNGSTYPMELHFVNQSASGAETVVAVFLQLGNYNPALQTVLDAASKDLTQPNSTTTINTPINFSGLLPPNLEGWFYQGSLTTPPLSQPVNWLVLSTPITLSYQQLQQYEAVAGGAGFLPNARPIQPLDGRQMNQFNIELNYRGGSILGVNFSFAPRALCLNATSVDANPNTLDALRLPMNHNTRNSMISRAAPKAFSRS